MQAVDVIPEPRFLQIWPWHVASWPCHPPQNILLWCPLLRPTQGLGKVLGSL